MENCNRNYFHDSMNDDFYNDREIHNDDDDQKKELIIMVYLKS